MERAWFSRIDLRPEAAHSARFTRLLVGDGYGIHQSLWQMFPAQPGGTRDFLYHRRRSDSESALPSFYVLSARPPQAHTAWHIHEPREYTPQIRTGDRLEFSLRANPVVSRRSGEGGERLVRHDVVMDAKRHCTEAGHAGEIEYTAGRLWLEARAAAHGFELEAVRVGAYERHRLSKGGRPPITFSTLDYEGILRVTDPERMRAALFKGIGPAKGFGCGLLLVRRA